MKLTIHDRILIQQMLPQKGNMIEMSVVKSIMDKTDLNEEEIEKYGVKFKEGIITFEKAHKDVEFDISFSDVEKTTIKKAIEELDKNGNIMVNMLDTISKIQGK